MKNPLFADTKFYDKNAKDNSVLIFNTEECENCGEICLSANSIKVTLGDTLTETKRNLRYHGLQPRDVPSNESTVNEKDEYGCSICT